MRTLYVILLLAGLAGCSHDTERANPLDPELTPPVELAVVVDDTSGTATLTWSRYTGEAPFAGYLVLRNVTDQVVVDTLAQIDAIEDTFFVDSTLPIGVGHDYRVATQNASGLLIATSAVRATPMGLPAVEIQSIQFDSRSATASVSWTPYEGPNFRAYIVERRTATEASRVVAEIDQVARTSLIDSSLLGNRQYIYRVSVETTRGETTESDEVSGAFHQQVAQWSIDLGEDAFVRLYAEPDHLLAVVGERRRTRLLFFDADGALLDEQVLHEIPMEFFNPRQASAALSSLGIRFVTSGDRIRQAVWAFTQDGQPLRPDPIVIESDDVGLESGERQSRLGLFGSGDVTMLWDQVELHSGGETFVDISTLNENHLNGWFRIGLDIGRFVRRTDVTQPSTASIGLTADFIVGSLDSGRGGLILEAGQPTFSDRLDEFFAELSFSSAVTFATLRWGITSPDGSMSVSDSLTTELDLLLNLPHRIGLSLRGRTLQATMVAPAVRWTAAPAKETVWTSIVAEGDGESTLLGVATGSNGFDLATDGATLRERDNIEGVVSEARVWQPPGEERRWIGICQPELHRVLYNTVSTRQFVRWPLTTTSTVRRLGEGAGADAGELLFPLSFDAGPDGRMFVLDAGNGRVASFTAEGSNLSHFRAADDSPFDFGTGSEASDFTGSIAVDGEGFIYVADVGNGRIVKFAP